MIPSFFLAGAVFLPLLAGVAVMISRASKARLGLQWMLAFLGVALSWLFLFGLRFSLPHSLSLATWQPQILFPLSPELLADGFSWAVALALATAGGAVLLTEATNPSGSLVFGWTSSLILLGLGLFAVFAGNELTLLLAWAAIDLVELGIWLSRPAQPTLRERVILAFSSRTFGVMLALWGLGSPWAYGLSILLRWGVFPFHLPYLESQELRRGLGTIIRLVPPLTTIPLLARLADYAYFQTQEGIGLLISLISLAATILWLNSTQPLEGRPFWIIATAAFAFYAATINRPEAVIAWGMILAFCGVLLFVFESRPRLWPVGIGAQMLLLLGLPFTPFWDILRIYRSEWTLPEVLLSLSHLFLAAGYLRFLLQKPDVPLPGEPWGKALYPLAFYATLGVSVAIGYGGWRSTLETALESPYLVLRTPLDYLLGLGLSLAGIGFAFGAKQLHLKRQFPAAWVDLLSLEWIYQALRWSFHQLGTLYRQVETILEGRGGLLWAWVVLLLLFRTFSLLSRGE